MPGFVGYGKRVASFTLPAFFTERTIQKLGEFDSSEGKNITAGFDFAYLFKA